MWYKLLQIGATAYGNQIYTECRKYKEIFKAAIYLIRQKAAPYMLKKKLVKKCDIKKYDHDVNDCQSQLLRHFLRLLVSYLDRGTCGSFLYPSLSLYKLYNSHYWSIMDRCFQNYLLFLNLSFKSQSQSYRWKL